MAITDDRPEWFAPKRYGYGTGLPIAWQGWVILIGYVGLVLCATPLAHRSLVAYVSLITILTIAFWWILARTTRGGLRWRSGGDD
jgi:hypothetical protein